MTNCEIPNGLLLNITEILKKDEGLSLTPYKDSNGYWTIGIGHYIGPSLENLKLTPEIVNQMLCQDIKQHWEDACEIFGADWLSKQTEARQAAILSLVFNLGERKLRSFIHTLPAIKNEEWARAAELLLNTKWARDVDPLKREGMGRDDRIAFMLREGKFHEDYNILG